MSQVKEGADIEKGGKIIYQSLPFGKPLWNTLKKMLIECYPIKTKGQKVFIVLHGEFRKNGSLTEDDPWGEEEGDS